VKLVLRAPKAQQAYKAYRVLLVLRASRAYKDNRVQLVRKEKRVNAAKMAWKGNMG
jgi:hypothetical protein